ncbi:ATP-binding cassette domain-containing protein [Nocardia aurantia]|uniref:Daunorubicin/doxorubicin resistance ATP-binding protein DrrA n=1 Tax=Nocardia aurantia TaxID=2585199 RepID=A0A7K0DZJ2_9NOCA|nr:ATP-binding cassette domain-containing protein [Nocardia aurantia]MQY31145.1 Daunorubicin/doxorubicin resistance ATP-binding protein DrrA [Nocardia aurantia]
MTPPPALAVSVTGLAKSFGGVPVLSGIDVKVPAATIFSLLGPNGAGKTTMVRILATLGTADRGEVRVGGHDVLREPDKVRRLIGVTGQNSAVDDVLTAAENLRLVGNLLHLPGGEIGRRADNLLKRFDLTAAAGKRAGALSGGTRRRLDLAMSLMGDPRILFLDEPTTGLDPRSRRELWAVIRDLVAGGVTIFLTTQYLEEADQLADRIAVLDGGKIVAEGTPAELKQLVPGGHVRLTFTDSAGLAAASRAVPAAEVDAGELALRVPSDGSAEQLSRLLGRFAEDAIAIGELTIHTPDLDDVFFALTGAPAAKETR